MKPIPKIVADTNVLVVALRSRRGASFRLLSEIRSGRFQPCVTVPLVMEDADVLARPGMVPLPVASVEAVIDMICREALQQTVHFLWHPTCGIPRTKWCWKRP